MPSQEYMDKMQGRQNYRNLWHSDLTQHKIEMDKRDGAFGPQPMAVPQFQQMSRFDQQVPPSVGYPPQPYPAQPVYGQPFPQAQPYPAAYPPSGYPHSGR